MLCPDLWHSWTSEYAAHILSGLGSNVTLESHLSICCPYAS